MNAAILGYATYVPRCRVDVRGSGKFTRVAASFDEDAVTMAVAATAQLLGNTASASNIDTLTFVTSSPPYLDKTNAAAIHAALGLERRVAVDDAIGTGRSVMAAFRRTSSGVIAAADVRTGQPGSADERGGADAAAALLIGDATADHPSLAKILAHASVTEEFLDRWRPADAAYAQTWEERFGFERYAPLIREVAAAALDSAGLAEADHVILTCPNTAVTKRTATLVKGTSTTGGSPLGFAGTVDPLLGLAAALDGAGPNETILLICAVDGADAVVLHTTDALVGHRQRRTSDAAAATREIAYPTYLSWRGLLDFEPPRRPEPDRPAGPPSARDVEWKFGLNGTRCSACGFVHSPPMRICRSCGTSDAMESIPMSSRRGRIATYTVDRLAYSPSPPVVDVVVDFDGGGRATFEVADPNPDLLVVGAPVEMVFRRLFTAQGIHNYFWKARQIAHTLGGDTTSPTTGSEDHHE